MNASNLIQRAVEVIRASGFLRDVSFLASGVFIAQVIALIASPLLTRIFSPQEFGAFSVAVAAASTVSVFATLRLETIIPAVHRPHVALYLLQVLIASSLAVVAAATVAVVALRSEIAAIFSLPPANSDVLLIVPPLISAFALYSGLRYWLIRTKRFREIGQGQVGRAIVNIALSIALGILGLGVQAPGLSLALGQLAGDSFYAGILARSMRRRDLRLFLRPDVERVRAALHDNSAMVATLISSQLLAAIYGRMPILVIAAAYGPVHAGWYALAERLVAAPTALLANTIGDVYRQRAAESFRAGRPFDALMRRILSMTLALSVVPFGAAIAAAPYFMGPLFGRQWQDAAFTLSVLLAGALFTFNATPVDKAAIIVGAKRYILTWHILRLILEAVAAFLAFAGMVTYELYVFLSVGGRGLLWTLDIAVEHRLAACSSPRARKTEQSEISHDGPGNR